jgi:hypothetical protein
MGLPPFPSTRALNFAHFSIILGARQHLLPGPGNQLANDVMSKRLELLLHGHGEPQWHVVIQSA